MKSGKLVLLRHGESQWNLENRFTGWVDVDLSAKGIEEAKEAGQKLAKLMKPHSKSNGFEFQATYTSLLKRAIKTHFLALEQMDRLWYPVQRSWRLNERHYGALQGLNKADTAKKYGDEQVKIWRRSYDTLPPTLSPDSEMNPKNDVRYATLGAECGAIAQPLAESLKLTIERVIPIWNESIAPQLNAGENVLVVAHGNSLRGLVKHIKKISDDEILSLEIPTGKPWLFEFGDSLQLASDAYVE